MGGDADPKRVNQLAEYVSVKYPRIRTGWYSGRSRLAKEIEKSNFDYIKIGPYLKHLGGLKESTTNQRLYKKVDNSNFVDITSRFWKKQA